MNQPGATGRPLISALIAAGISLACSLALIATQRIPQRVAFDVVVYHEPAARQFAADWLAFDFRDYLSATTPGFHLLLAALVKFVSGSFVLMQIASAVITGMLAGVVGWGNGGRASPLWAVLLTLPVMLSAYVMQAGAWPLPDNLGWLGVAAVLVMALRLRTTVGAIVCFGAALAALVFVRQSHLWVAAAMLAAMWMAPSPPGGVIRSLVFRWRQRLPRTLLATAACIPAVLILWWFWRLWGGLTPPRFAAQHQGANWATPAFVLANLGVVSLCFAPLLAPAAVGAWKHARGWLIVALVAGLACARIPATTYDLDAGRSSGLWNLAKVGPVEGESSLVILGLALLGALSVVVWVRALPQKHGVVFLAAVGGFMLAQIANHNCWQRYVEPVVLILCSLSGASVWRAMGEAGPLRRRLVGAGLVGLCVLLAGANVATLRPFPTIEAYREGYRREGVPPIGGAYVPKSQRGAPGAGQPE
ncbi:MAG: hypothetical protein DYG92_13240 [Leptolyngbya sp. PLA1]|nr:hypothetical protein [Leptolyngbya sp. PLA1]